MPFHLIREDREVVGKGYHRSGWPFVMERLKELSNGNGLALDDFMERSFSYDPLKEPYDHPWATILHHPPGLLCPPHRVEEEWAHIFQLPTWKESVKNLKLAICMTFYQARMFEKFYPGIPTVVLKHPTSLQVPWWSWNAFKHNEHKKLIQVGWYLRNTRAIFHIDDRGKFKRERFLANYRHIMQYDKRVIRMWKEKGTRKEHTGVRSRTHLKNEQYDWELTRNVVLTEVLEAAANNVVIECIARCTPIIVNRHPAIVEYLGEHYPLYFNEIEEVESLYRDDLIQLAHRHMIDRIDRKQLSIETFTNNLLRAVEMLK